MVDLSETDTGLTQQITGGLVDSAREEALRTLNEHAQANAYLDKHLAPAIAES